MDAATAKEFVQTLNKAIIALDRIKDALAPLLAEHVKQVETMPELPAGLTDCAHCDGHGYVSFIDIDTDLWTTKKCECV